MPKIIENEKGFKVIKIKVTEMFTAWGGGARGICDRCNQICTTKDGMEGYYVCVLNQVFCQEDYDDWYKNATYYKEDRGFELAKFKELKNKFPNL